MSQHDWNADNVQPVYTCDVPPDPLTGMTLADRYKVGRFVDEGRTGRIYVGQDRREKRRVALKILHPVLCNVEEQVRRFQREFEVTSQISHPNCVNMHEFGTFQGHRYLVMEYLDGKGLDQTIGKGDKMTPRKAARIARQVAEALTAAHALNVIHRDLNPSNIMLCKVGRQRDVVKVLDFGLARLQGSTEELTGVGERLGTAHYMAPEYIQGTGLDPRSDLYGLGCVLFEMLTGRTPFIGPPLRVLESQVTHTAPSPASLVPGTPSWLDALVVQLLEKSPDARPENADEVVERLIRGLKALEVDLERERAAASAKPKYSHPQSIIPTGMGSSTTGPLGLPGRPSEWVTEPAFVPVPKRPSWLWLIVIVLIALVLSTVFGTLLTLWTTAT
jgi:eukaryotic-like serine/threonine-protein kinase